jgi:hypothetical protein
MKYIFCTSLLISSFYPHHHHWSGCFIRGFHSVVLWEIFFFFLCFASVRLQHFPLLQLCPWSTIRFPKLNNLQKSADIRIREMCIRQSTSKNLQVISISYKIIRGLATVYRYKWMRRTCHLLSTGYVFCYYSYPYIMWHDTRKSE